MTLRIPKTRAATLIGSPSVSGLDVPLLTHRQIIVKSPANGPTMDTAVITAESFTILV